MKWQRVPLGVLLQSRSREGAWIEINIEAHKGDKNVGRSREGAWIEIASQDRKLLPILQSLPRGSVD